MRAGDGRVERLVHEGVDRETWWGAAAAEDSGFELSVDQLAESSVTVYGVQCHSNVGDPGANG